MSSTSHFSSSLIHPPLIRQYHQQCCGHCEHWLLPSDRFCEACGNAIPQPPCPNCGASAEHTDDEDFCIQCGFRQAQSENQQALSLSEQLAAGSDIGLHHPTNQDAFALAQLPSLSSCGGTESRTILVVCDGISSSPRAELASQTAAAMIVNAVMSAAVENPPTGFSQTSSSIPWLEHAFMQAQQEVMALSSPNVESPSTTAISAIVESGLQKSDHLQCHHRITLAWLGDSRAYWLSSQGVCLLSADHKTEQGSLTRWLGSDANLSRDPPQFRTFYPRGPGSLLLCSDGLWNYAPQPEQMQALLQSLEISDASTHPPDASTLVGSLIQFAKQQGGHDNITIALQKIP